MFIYNQPLHHHDMAQLPQALQQLHNLFYFWLTFMVIITFWDALCEKADLAGQLL